LIEFIASGVQRWDRGYQKLDFVYSSGVINVKCNEHRSTVMDIASGEYDTDCIFE
jgi:hypothetical protein